MFVIEDERHAEHLSRFVRFEHAVAELRRMAKIPWDQEPNVAPCNNWPTCGRKYVFIDYDVSQRPWTESRRVAVLDVAAAGITCSSGFEDAE